VISGPSQRFACSSLARCRAAAFSGGEMSAARLRSCKGVLVVMSAETNRCALSAPLEQAFLGKLGSMAFPAALKKGNPSITDVPVLLCLPLGFVYFGLAHSLGLLLESALAALFLLPFLGVHLLLSHLWLFCMLITLTVDRGDRPLLVTSVGLFGYFAVIVPWYLGMMMCAAKGIFFPRLVSPPWAHWTICQAGRYSERSIRDCDLFDRRFEWPVNHFLFGAVFHLLDFTMHLFPAIVAIRAVDPSLLGAAFAIGVPLQTLWFLTLDRNRSVYIGALPSGHLYLATQPPAKRLERLLGCVNIDSFRRIYGLDTPEALKAIGLAEMCSCFLIGWAVGLLLAFHPAALEYVALRAAASDSALWVGWLCSALAALAAMVGAVIFGLPAIIGRSMEVSPAQR
jgi:hypothetical protein